MIGGDVKTGVNYGDGGGTRIVLYRFAGLGFHYNYAKVMTMVVVVVVVVMMMWLVVMWRLGWIMVMVGALASSCTASPARASTITMLR